MNTRIILAIAACASIKWAAADAQYPLIPMPSSIATIADGQVAPERIAYRHLPDSLAPEAYSIEITPSEIIIGYADDRGMRWAQRTLEQLSTPDGLYPQVKIDDAPAFGLRGFMYDSGRNFVEVEQIEEMIDLCSRYKLNAFHWHLTDHPAWRIESRAYPQLNDDKYQRIGRDAGRFYTYADIHRVVDYARQRGVLVIPEIDMPGHSTYFKTTFGTTMNTPEGMTILEACLREFFDEFPPDVFPYIHIGSDEIHIDNPQEFMSWLVSLVEAAGRTPIVWDPGLDAGPNARYQVWRDGSANPEAVPADKKIIDSYMGYLNYVDPMIMTNRMALHTPCIPGRDADANIGGILCLWNDVRVIDKSRIPVHNGMMGGVLPFAEVFWRGTAPEVSHADVLADTADTDMQRLMELHERMLRHKERFLPAELAYWQPNRPATEWQMQLLDAQGNVAYEGKCFGDVVDFAAISRSLGLDSVAEARISRQIWCEADTVVNCRIGFDAPARSNRLGDGIAQQGKWENFGQVVVNGQEVLPPVWNEPGLYQYHFNTWARPEEELAYTDEQLYWTREPVAIQLRKGPNTISLSTRLHFPGQHFQAALLDMP